MQRFRMMAPARWLVAIAALWACQLVVPATSFAQETEEEKTVKEKRVVVEVRDGKILVNGEESEVGDDGHIVIRKGDGDEVYVVMEKDGPVWFSTSGIAKRARADAERAAEMARGLYRYRVPRPDGELFEMEFEPPVLKYEDFDVDVDVDVEDRLADVFENVEVMRGNLMHLRRQSEELRKIETAIREKSRQLRRAEEGDQAALESELDELVQKAFTMKLEEEQKQVEELQERLQEMQHRLQERQAQREEIIERRKKELLGRRDNLDW